MIACPLFCSLDLARTKKTARIDSPCLGPIFSRIQDGIWMSEETGRHLELLASTSVVSRTPQLVSSVEESESESDPVVEEVGAGTEPRTGLPVLLPHSCLISILCIHDRISNMSCL